MRIGIITMHRVPNYGSFLQAYAMKRVLEQYGHSVIFVDFRPGKVPNMSRNEHILALKNRMFSIASKSKFLTEILPLHLKRTGHAVRDYRLNVLPLLNVSKAVHNPDIDVLLIGSDEVFNCTQRNPNIGYSRDLFGWNTKAKYTLTYAASFGNTSIEKLQAQRIEGEVASSLSKINRVSMRDNNSIDIYHELTGKRAEKHIDPVLLYPFGGETQKVNEPANRYAVLYSYPGRMRNHEIDAIKKYVENHNLKLICFPLVFQDTCDEVIDGNPFDVLAYFRNADCVFTDTFHGTIFSIITQRPFITFVRSSHGGSYGNEEKLDDLLRTFGLQDRKAKDVSSIEALMKLSIDYAAVNTILERERIRSHEFLESSLNQASDIIGVL